MGDETSNQCPALAVTDTVALGFKLIGAELTNVPERITNVLSSPKFIEAVKKGLDEEAKKFLKKNSATTPDGKQLLMAAGTVLQSAAVDDVKRQIESSGHFRDFKQSAETLKKAMICRAASSPVGVWINEHERVVIVVGVVGLLGTVAAAIYDLAAHGSDSTTADVQAAAKAVTSNFVVRKLIGTIELFKRDGFVVNYKPGDGSIKFEANKTTDWVMVQGGLEVNGLYETPKAMSATATASASAKLGPTTTARAEGKLGYKAQDNSFLYSLGLGVTQLLPDKRGTLDILATVQSPTSPGGRTNYSAGLVLTFPFDLGPKK